MLPGTQQNSFNLGSTVTASNYFAASAVATVTVAVTATWTHGNLENDSNDPAPLNVWLCESSTATWSGAQVGSASDGLGPEYKLTPSNNFFGGTASTSDAPASTPPAYWKSWAVTAGVITLPTRTLRAEADYSLTFLGNYCAATISNYSVTVHPQPYNMRLTPDGANPAVYVDNVGGRLSFHYSISSTDGNIGDLTSISAYEYLDWGSSNPGIYQTGMYIPPSPPIAVYSDGVHYAYPTISKIIFPFLLQGYVVDGFSPPTTGFVAPYPSPPTVWSVTQNYLFDDSATGQVGVKIPGPDDNSPFTITRSVAPTNAAGTTGIYAVSTRGYSALKSLP